MENVPLYAVREWVKEERGRGEWKRRVEENGRGEWKRRMKGRMKEENEEENGRGEWKRRVREKSGGGER